MASAAGAGRPRRVAGCAGAREGRIAIHTTGQPRSRGGSGVGAALNYIDVISTTTKTKPKKRRHRGGRGVRIVGPPAKEGARRAVGAETPGG